MGINMAIVAIASAFIGVASGSQRCNDKVKYVYVSTSDNRAIVFDMRTSYLNFVDKRLKNPGQSSSEFGGSFVNCTSAKYYCISGPIDFVIPKDMRSQVWSYGEARCTAQRTHNEDEYVVQCTSPFGSRDRVTRFRYSSTNGILAFRDLKPTRDATFTLEGQCGLFAKGEGEKGVGKRNGCNKGDGGN